MLYVRRIEDFNKINICERHSFQHNFALSLLFDAVLEEYNIKFTEDDIKMDENGKPYFKNQNEIYFSISHSKETVAVMLSKYPCGVDIEIIREDFPHAVLKRCFCEDEINFIKNSKNPAREFFALWTLKESYSKALGVGLRESFKNFTFKIDKTFINSNTNGDYSQIEADNYIISSCIIKKCD